VPGEESLQVTGLKELYTLKDGKLFEEMGKDIAALRKKKPEERAKVIEEFKTKHAANLGVLIDPDHPDFGPKNNQFVYFWGARREGAPTSPPASPVPSARSTPTATRRSVRVPSTSPARP